LEEVDREALERAIALTLVDPDRVSQLTAMLAERGWLAAAKFASYHMQVRNLRCLPWESPPCWIGPDHDVEAQYLEIGRRLLERGLSLFEPDPLQALERAKQGVP
jgi:hypothetical protein